MLKLNAGESLAMVLALAAGAAMWSAGPAHALLVPAQQPASGAIFQTSDSQLTPGVDNRGWWSATLANDDRNDDYTVGIQKENETRSFFTFDLSGLTAENVVSAKLEVQRYFASGVDLSETLALFDVSTDAVLLNLNTGTDAAIFDDLGTGNSYGSMNVALRGNADDFLSFSLNAAAITDINAARGGFFSIGGALLSLTAPPAVHPEELLLGSSFGPGVQRLVVCFDTDADGDADGFCDAIDNCAAGANADQLDSDNDGIGDVCDPCALGESDGDGVCDASDTCPLDDNADQADADGDGLGDVCDNCPGVPNQAQDDDDYDGIGDLCDATPFHDLAVDSVRAAVSTIHVGDRFQMTETVIIRNHQASPERFIVFLTLDDLPEGCDLMTLPYPLAQSIGGFGKKTMIGKFNVECKVSVAPGVYPVTMSAYVQNSLGTNETAYNNNSARVLTTLTILP